MIVAGSVSPPWAYMALFGDIVNDITSCFPDPTIVKLPSFSPKQKPKKAFEPDLSDAGIRPANLGVPGLVEIPVKHPGNPDRKSHVDDHPLGNEPYPPSLRSSPPNPFLKPVDRITHILSRLSCGIGDGSRIWGRLKPINSRPNRVKEVSRTSRKEVRHYPRSPARSRREASLHPSQIIAASAQGYKRNPNPVKV
jgi:hypothetical protein